ncbi:MAG: two-component system sensor histidine kinase NtrB, partial [Persicimonas sp.]
CPVVMVGNPEEAGKLLEAKRHGLEAYLLRAVDSEIFTDLLAEEIHTQLKRFVEPPTMENPSADQMYRYAQFHNVLEPFFVVARRRYLLYVNQAGQDLVVQLHDNKPMVGARLESWVLEGTLEEFNECLDQAFAGHAVVHERHFEALDDEDGVRELHYQPVTDPHGRVVAVSLAASDTARPELQRARTMQQLTGLAATISHENNNLLNVLMSNTELLAHRLRELGDDKALKRLEKIEGAIERSARFTHQLQAFSRTSVSRPERIDLSELIDELSDSLDALVPANMEVQFDLDRDLPEIDGDRDHWQTAVVNLVKNGASQMNEGGRLVLETHHLRVTPAQERVPVAPGNYVVLEVIYDGPALHEWMRARIFDPFFTDRRADRHAGLELATVKSIVEQGGGRMVVDNRDDQTVTCIYYPALDPPEERAGREQRNQPGGRQ